MKKSRRQNRQQTYGDLAYLRSPQMHNSLLVAVKSMTELQKVWAQSMDGLLSLPWRHPQSDPLGDIVRTRSQIEANYRNGVSDA